MALGDRFNRSGTSTGQPRGGAAKPAAAGAKRASKWGGVSAEVPRAPMPEAGVYRFRVTGIELGNNPGKGSESVKISLAVVEAQDGSGTAAETECLVPFIISGKSAMAGKGRVKAFFIAAAGYESEADYDAFDPDGDYIATQLGESTVFADQPGIVGRLVDCEVRKGKAVRDEHDQATGDYYREYTWFAVPDEEQV